ncbi:uncharacterized protein F4822DRAFT_277318 [Hypoxylon trugodes]|uniref:uncharacterized protein n=1 Tax=Hypoxylon trugodes TaxID=326681 RepID=UPI00218DA6B0|nr:uncharacterized protein F4822DRAFT_277318 [Hypoxylon trugodes]KAI1387248.1 hypothetical protein F4822DRAFT_277318 [Hypoxylon trugodes]
MAQDLCGPSNAAKGLTRHAEQDRSLQRELRPINTPERPFGTEFRSNSAFTSFTDARFGAFEASSASLFNPFPDDASRNVHHIDVTSLNPRSSIPRIDAAGSPGWVRDFQRMGLDSYVPLTPQGQVLLTAPTPAAPVRVPIPRNFGQYHIPPSPDRGTLLVNKQDNFSSNLNSNSNFDFDTELHKWMEANATDVPDVQTWPSASVTESIELRRGTTAARDATNATNHLPMEQDIQGAPQQPVASLQPEPNVAIEQTQAASPANDSELAVAAQQILNAVADNDSDKFKNSGFLRMMERIAAQDLVVRNNALVEVEDANA